jgi:hypothetical protein
MSPVQIVEQRRDQSQNHVLCEAFVMRVVGVGRDTLERLDVTGSSQMRALRLAPPNICAKLHLHELRYTISRGSMHMMSGQRRSDTLVTSGGWGEGQRACRICSRDGTGRCYSKDFDLLLAFQELARINEIV